MSKSGLALLSAKSTLALRKRAIELLMLCGLSLAFLFTLAVAFGFISG